MTASATTINNQSLDALKVSTAVLSGGNLQADQLALTINVDPGQPLSSEFDEGNTVTVRSGTTILYSGEVQPHAYKLGTRTKSHALKALGGFQLLLDTPLVIDGRAAAIIPSGSAASQIDWLWANSDITPGLALSRALPTHTCPERAYLNTTLGAAVRDILSSCETASSLVDFSTTPKPTLTISYIDPAEDETDRPQIDVSTGKSDDWSKSTKPVPSVHINFVRDTQISNEWTDRYGVKHTSSSSRQDLISSEKHPTSASPAKSSVVADLTIGGTKAIRNVSSVYNFTNGGTSGYQTLGHLKDKYYFGSYYAHVGILKAVKAMNFESKTGLELEEFGVIDNDYKGYGLAEGNYWYPIISSINVEELYNPSGITYAEDDLFWLREVPVVGSYYASSQVNLITEELKDVAGVVFCRADITVKWWTGVPTISPNTNKSTTWSVDCIYKADWSAGSSYSHTRQIIEEVDYETVPTGLAAALYALYNEPRYGATKKAYNILPPASPVVHLMNDTTPIGPALLQSTTRDLKTNLQTLTLGAPTQLAPQDLLTRLQNLKQ